MHEGCHSKFLETHDDLAHEEEEEKKQREIEIADTSVASSLSGRLCDDAAWTCFLLFFGGS